MRRSEKGSTAEREGHGSTASRDGERNDRHDASDSLRAPLEAEWHEFSRDYSNGRYRQVLRRRSRQMTLIVVGAVVAALVLFALVRLVLAV